MLIIRFSKVAIALINRKRAGPFLNVSYFFNLDIDCRSQSRPGQSHPSVGETMKPRHYGH